MSYTPTDWKTGDVITAEKLNNMESGIAGGGEGNSLIITVSGLADRDNPTTEPTVNKTVDDVYDAISSGKNILIRTEQNSNISIFSGLCSCGIATYDEEPEKYVSLITTSLVNTPSYTEITQLVLFGRNDYWSSDYQNVALGTT